MFEHLAAHPRILVTGPQRAGTTIASRMIAHDTGHRCVDEAEFGVYDVRAWRRLLELDRVVIQCPHMLKLIVDEPREDVLVVLMRRALADIHASEQRIGWEENYRGNSAELAPFGRTLGSSAEIKYAYWQGNVKPPHFVELSYETLRDHPFYVPAARRASFGRKDTGLAVTTGTCSAGVADQVDASLGARGEQCCCTADEDHALADGWRSWLATSRLLGSTDDQILQESQQHNISPQLASKELTAMGEHPYYLAGEQLGYRVRKLEALLDAIRTVSRTSRHGVGVDCRSGVGESDFVELHYSRNRPVVLAGLAEQWPAREWTPESLAARCGTRLTTVKLARGQAHQLAQRMLMSAFLEAITGADVTGEEYLSLDQKVLAHPDNSSLLADLRPRPPFLGNDADGSSTFVWFGPPGMRTGLHYEPVNVVLVQLLGRKHVLLVSPDQTPLLYNTSGVSSQVDPESPDTTRHPAFGECRLAELTLSPGDALFIPVGWWHHLRSVDVNLCVSFTRFTVDNDFPRLRRAARETSPLGRRTR
jgi:Cupin-like domain